MLRACITCKDEYYGDSWGVTFKSGLEKDPQFADLTNEFVMCFYCYYGAKERQYQPEWSKVNE
jgi:hypothetical protein